MSEDKRIPEKPIERSLGTQLLVATVTGTTAGAANAVAHQAFDKLTGKDKPKQK